MNFDKEKISGILAYLAIAGGFLASIATIAQMISPKWGMICLAVSHAIASFTKRVQRVGRRKMPKAFMSSILIVSVLFMSACPSAKTLRDFKETSAKMKIYGIKLIQANIDAFKAGEISQADLAKLNAATGGFVEAVKIYDEALKQTEIIVKETKTLPKDALDKLSIIFNEKVVDAFFKILEVLSPNAQTETIKNIIAGIRLTILAIGAALGEFKQMQGEAYA